MTIEFERAGIPAGVIARGVDFAAIDDAAFDALHTAFLDHHVLCIRGSQITREQHLEFAGRWGTVHQHPYVPHIEGYPGMMLIYQHGPITETWHADTTHVLAPPKITTLVAREIPPIGGDTAFSNQHLAYDSLSEGMRSMLDRMFAVHYGTDLAYSQGVDAKALRHAHPVVVEHEESGLRGLYVNADYTRHFEGWTAEESKGLLEFLFAQATRLEFVYRHRWEPGDLIMWDNRIVQHRVIPDHGDATRLLDRVTLHGDPMHGPAGDSHKFED
jgi:taurine dioxygenase